MNQFLHVKPFLYYRNKSCLVMVYIFFFGATISFAFYSHVSEIGASPVLWPVFQYLALAVYMQSTCFYKSTNYFRNPSVFAVLGHFKEIAATHL